MNHFADVSKMVALVLLIAACASKPSLQTSTRCPELPTYPPAMQAAVLEDLKTASWRIRRLVEDYGDLRAKCRALQ